MPDFGFGKIHDPPRSVQHGRRLIVNGDDFGISEEVNNAIILAHNRGVLTSCSLMPGGASFGHAVRLARENPSLAVGIHITCVAGKAVLPHREIPAITDRSGGFPDDPALAGLKYFFCKRARKELFREVAAQFEMFFASGITCSHLDSHCHMHVNPAVLDILVKLGEEYGVKRIRVPDDHFFGALPFLRRPWASAGYALVFKLLSARMKRELTKRGFKFPSRVYGNILTGEMSREYALSVLERVSGGVSEIYFHPALLADSGRHDPKALQRFRELGVLLDPEIKSKMNMLGILPATYPDLDRF